MSDLTTELRKISTIQFLCVIGLVASFVVGLMSIMACFDEVLNIVLGSLSAVVLLASITGLWKMSWRTFEVEESFHNRNYALRTTLLEGRPW